MDVKGVSPLTTL